MNSRPISLNRKLSPAAAVSARLRADWTRISRAPVIGPALRYGSPFIPLVILWQILTGAQLWPAYLFPGPSAVLSAFVEAASSGLLVTHIWNSLIRVALGFSAGLAIALPLGMLMGMNRTASAFFTPIVTFFQAIPGLAWIPLAILWFGLGYTSVTFIIFLSVFFPILVMTVTGVRGISESMINAALTLGANRAVLVREVYFPGALAAIIAGVRIGFAYAWRSLVGAEMIASTTGLGFMIFDARMYLRTDLVLLGMILLGLFWLVIDSAFLRPLERRTVERWGLQH